MTGRASLLLATLLGFAIGCAGKRGDSKAPGQACLEKCEQKECGYVPDNLGDNTEYLECVDACVEKCR